MLLQVHDELIFEGPESEAEAATALITSLMETAAEPVLNLLSPLSLRPYCRQLGRRPLGNFGQVMSIFCPILALIGSHSKINSRPQKRYGSFGRKA